MKNQKTLAPAEQLERVRHSLAHLLAAAVMKKFPDAQLGIGPVIEDGFYYDFKLPRPLSSDDLKELENAMRHMARAHYTFKKKNVPALTAKKLLKNQPFKHELVKEIIKEKKQISFYETDNIFEDLCAGPHVKNTDEIDADAFRLTKIAGAYWRGDSTRDQLQRIYGVAFANKKELEEYLKRIIEAQKRDHKKLGPELDLFTFSDLVGGGLPLWTPKGMILRTLLDQFVWSLREAQGYERVEIPHITKKELYERSGHWEKFKDELFKIVTREGHVFAMKPMNCPHHTQIYKRKIWSYRELPQRYANTTMVYRDEQTGELAGLTRVRSITQDDAHVFCRYAQIQEEILKIWDIVYTFYHTFGFTLNVRLALHDPRHFEQYLGTKAVWKQTEQILRDITKTKNITPIEALGEAAFYGPKLDFLAKDSLGREWQVATIQLDMNLPERFDLDCISEEGKPERIVMIHAAIMGSIERFLAILIEHCAGRFPLWLSPVQAIVLPISADHLTYGTSIYDTLHAASVRMQLSADNTTLGKRIRAAEIAHIPYIIIVGGKEIETKTVSVRHNVKGDLGTMSLANLQDQLLYEINLKRDPSQQ